jgi:hypothetical protein
MNIQMQEIIRNLFPKASTWPEITREYLHKLSAEYQIPLSKVLFASCICPDELNYRATNFNHSFPQAFYLGGLGGIPYTGKTGMAAYASHVPEDGASFIFYGPHVGISKDGTIGVIHREHQHTSTYSCGALLSVLEHMKKDIPFDWSSTNFEDLQARVIEKLLHNHKDRIFESDQYVLEAVKIMFEVSSCMLRQFVVESEEAFPCKHVFLLGGIMINTDAGLENYVEIQSFEHIKLKEGVSKV